MLFTEMGKDWVQQVKSESQPEIQGVTVSWELDIRFKKEVQTEIHLGE